MNHPILGNLITDSQQRDAIHIAVAPVIATERLKPGQHIGLAEGGNMFKVSGTSPTKIGIVDPFLKRPVEKGESFWMCLYPQTTQNLRHDWSHPAFTAAEVVNKLYPHESETYLRDFADSVELSYTEMMEAAAKYAKTGEYLGIGFSTPDYNPEEFWRHYAAVTGHIVKSTPEDQGHWISCAC